MAKLQIDEQLVRKLAELLKETGLSEIEYEVGGQRIRVGRGGGGVENSGAAPAIAPAAANTAIQAAGHNGQGDNVPAGAITAPMVGTVYVAGEPGASPFVKVGDAVTEGQTLLIIEAMKVMNPLSSPQNGTIKQIMISDGQPVEYGEPLLVIE